MRSAIASLIRFSPCTLQSAAPSMRRLRGGVGRWSSSWWFSGARSRITCCAAREGLSITMIERGPWLGRGIAYGVDSRLFRLNVPASKMSIDPRRLRTSWNGPVRRPTRTRFLSRAVYGDYVVAKLAEAIRSSRGKMRFIRATCLRPTRRASTSPTPGLNAETIVSQPSRAAHGPADSPGRTRDRRLGRVCDRDAAAHRTHPCARLRLTAIDGSACCTRAAMRADHDPLPARSSALLAPRAFVPAAPAVG